MGSNETRNLWLSIAAGVFATFLLYSYSQEKKAEYDKRYGTTKRVVVAKEDIAEMQTIYDTMVETKELPADFIQPDAITIPDEIIGNVAAVPIRKGQMVVKNNLLTPGPDTGIALQVAPSKRAVAIPVDEVRGVAKLIRPGDRVDIFAAVDSGKGVNQRREVFTMLSDVVVLATGVSVMNNIPRMFELDSTGKNLTQIALTGDTKYTTITVEATPKEAQDLFYILSTAPGNIFFALRNPNDRTVPPRMPSSTAESVAGKPVVSMDTPAQAPPIAVPQRPVYTPPVQQRTAPPSERPRTNGFQTL
ncbi:MAG: pilus assembly protein CpaB [Bdellovibrio sp. ArHS]|uniref:Flp pilus assembly protein CpaB n=1 Tax=Bdellovibrio sp. ArHS TaxID=1569284 RepID=UPI00058396C9|nr:Flp pilus assembly protein CpaB [Bdellovibrio sp. ArHS]KHD88539.1 MAG: pilus assembly protein CpaB [Bdellovibrio sp. ArHS]